MEAASACRMLTWAASVRLWARKASCSSYLAPRFLVRLGKTRPHHLPGGPPPPYPMCSSSSSSSNTTPSPTSPTSPLVSRSIPFPPAYPGKGNAAQPVDAGHRGKPHELLSQLGSPKIPPQPPGAQERQPQHQERRQHSAVANDGTGRRLDTGCRRRSCRVV